MEQLLHKLQGYAKEDALFILAGSIPTGVDTGIYARIIQLVHEKGAKVLLDADGDLFCRALSVGPDMMKPNRAELEEYAGLDHPASRAELLELARKFIRQGVQTVAVSMGKNGAMFVRPGYEAECPALSVKAHSTVGAGDAMVAALAYAWNHKLSDDDTVRLCMAASAGAVTTIGTEPPVRELVDMLMKEVIIERN